MTGFEPGSSGIVSDHEHRQSLNVETRVLKIQNEKEINSNEAHLSS